jgi:hypothetical protein
MLAKQFPTSASKNATPGVTVWDINDENTKPAARNFQSPSRSQIMSPTVMGAKGHFSANKRKAVEIIREAIKREEAGRVESALRLCEDAAAVFPEKAIVVGIHTALATLHIISHALLWYGT